jgi:hypothetical protein
LPVFASNLWGDVPDQKLLTQLPTNWLEHATSSGYMLKLEHAVIPRRIRLENLPQNCDDWDARTDELQRMSSN